MQPRLVCSYQRFAKPFGPIFKATIGCPETSVTNGTSRLSRNFVNYQYMLCNIPEERGFRLHRGGNLKSCIASFEAQVVRMSCYCVASGEGIPIIVILKCGCELLRVRPPGIFMVSNLALCRRHFQALRRNFLHTFSVFIDYFYSGVLGRFYMPATLRL
jgi:hypothetical protein